MRHKKAGVRLALERADQSRRVFNPGVRALLAAIAATALTAAPAHAKTTLAPSFWTTQRVEGGVASLIAQQTPLYAKNVSVDSVRCVTGGSRRWFCVIRVRNHGRLDPVKYLYTVWIDRRTGGLDARGIN